ncbi:MAG: YceI family protein [Pseudomonadota bacterium]|nr:YceI family protein [Pseudomonadota bacterium]
MSSVARLLSPALLLAALVAAPASSAEYVQAPGSTLVFAGKYDGEVFVGRFPGFATTLDFDPARPADAQLDVAIPLHGAVSGNVDRDETLLGSDFFNVSRFPQARYTATGFRPLGGDRYAADGTLSLRGVSRPVTLTFTWAPGAVPVLSGKATVPRLAFGIGSGDWADTQLMPDAIAVSTKVLFTPRP